MFGYFKRKREQQESAIDLQKLGEVIGGNLHAELDLYIAISIVPRRKAFIDVFIVQLQTLDERLVEFEEAEKVTRLELASIDYRIMLESWSEHGAEQMDEAEKSLQEQFDIADAAGVADEYRASVRAALANQKFELMSDGLEVFMAHFPEAHTDHASALNQ